MQMPDVPINVPVDDPNADTEWNDILRSKGIIPPKPPSESGIIEEALTEARRLAHDNRLEGKDLDELAALEDEEDDDFLEQYRKKRMAELSEIRTTSVYNQVYPIQKPDYARDVTEESKKAWILVLLTSSHGVNVESRVLSEIWRTLAQKFGNVKFCQMRADLCIEGYPDKNTPTVLVYKDGDIRRQLVTLKELKGPRTQVEDVERVLVDVGALELGDPRLKKKEEEEERKGAIKQGTVGKKAGVDDDDSDWD